MALDYIHTVSHVFFLFSVCALVVHMLHAPVSGDNSGYISASIASLLPSENCSTTPKGNGYLTISNRYGPCSPLSSRLKSNYSELLEMDIPRIHFMALRLSGMTRTKTGSNWNVLPMQAVRFLGQYVVLVGFGTPTASELLSFDTGSDLTWLQCQPCIGGCKFQPTPVFDPSRSSTYQKVSCSDPACSLLGPNKGGCDVAADKCLYVSAYGTGAASGVLGADTVALTSNLSFTNFPFGCGYNVSDDFTGISGLLGLARSPISVPTMLSQWYGGAFSYCLPASSSNTGHLTIGNDTGGMTFSYTPMITSKPYFYFVELIGISVGGQLLPIPPAIFASPGTILDSGTTVTYLLPSAYATLRDAFNGGMTNYKMSTPVLGLDTCYDLTGYSNVSVPKIALHFGGGSVLELGLPGIFFVLDTAHHCLAFSTDESMDGLTVIGNTQQRTFEVFYDVTNSRIGFASGTCG